ncbi:winged helix-turn-helix transcriptional regulator [Bacillus luteolus]|uniref:Winged helix-turn-helix transcriptional regulator n=1 Tax=Litchfieldia luteola TaxID=682179 RepID=A0ABR9QEW5_9BACI|nr:winged helix-turn-helix domain-containing protein [Cytobacillus luteolus]MBE4907032.1 winged helix-turn-helix transcriptional regulator [Cytobacillus luteolus]MBP1943501.1 DNA-binding transcriptional ArsR family regulator [Cytobacillus luteolus]
MTYKVKVDYSPIYELINSLELFVSKKFVKSLDLGIDWVKSVEEQIEPGLLEELRSKDVPCLSYLNVLLYLSPQKEEITGFINWLQELTPGNLYELLSPIIADNLPNDLGTIRDSYVHYLSLWNKAYFSTFDPQVLEELKKSKAYYESLSTTKYSTDLVEKASGGIRIEPFEGLKEVVLVPGYHNTPLTVYWKYKNTYIIRYPVDIGSEDASQPSKQLVRLTKALADENRLRILQYVANEPRTFTDILNYINISKSTVHHHIMALRSAGLISVYHTDQCCAELYRYRASGFSELADSFQEFVHRVIRPSQ